MTMKGRGTHSAHMHTLSTSDFPPPAAIVSCFCLGSTGWCSNQPTSQPAKGLVWMTTERNKRWRKGSGNGKKERKNNTEQNKGCKGLQLQLRTYIGSLYQEVASDDAFLFFTVSAEWVNEQKVGCQQSDFILLSFIIPNCFCCCWQPSHYVALIPPSLSFSASATALPPPAKPPPSLLVA